MRNVRGILCVAAILCIALPVAAEMTAQTSTSGHQPPNNNRQSTLLYDQTANWASSGSSTQDFEAAYDAYDAEGADDFVVTNADGWLVDGVGVIGSYSTGGGPLGSMHVTIFDDAGGAPGAAHCTYMSNGYTDDGAGNFFMALPAACFLPAGTYWVDAQGQVDYGTGGQYFWGLEGVQTGAEGVWRNPGNGFGNGCVVFTARSSCGYTIPDYSFQIWGENAQPGPTPTTPVTLQNPVPTMNRYGVIAMVVLLLGVAVLVISRRK